MEEASPVPDSDVMACIASLVATHGPQMADQSRREALRLLLYVTMPDHEAQIEQTIAYLNQNPARQAGAVTSVAATPDPAIAPGKGSAPRDSGPPPTSQQPDEQVPHPRRRASRRAASRTRPPSAATRRRTRCLGTGAIRSWTPTRTATLPGPDLGVAAAGGAATGLGRLASSGGDRRAPVPPRR